MGLHFIKNGTKHDVCVKRPSLFPASATTYDNTNHPELPNRVQGVIDGVAEVLNGKLLASVTGDGVKTYRELLNELHGLLDQSELTGHSYLELADGFFPISEIYNGNVTFSRIAPVETPQRVDIRTFMVSSANSLFYTPIINSDGTISFVDRSTTALTDGVKINIYK